MYDGRDEKGSDRQCQEKDRSVRRNTGETENTEDTEEQEWEDCEICEETDRQTGKGRERMEISGSGGGPASGGWCSGDSGACFCQFSGAGTDGGDAAGGKERLCGDGRRGGGGGRRIFQSLYGTGKGQISGAGAEVSGRRFPGECASAGKKRGGSGRLRVLLSGACGDFLPAGAGADR